MPTDESDEFAALFADVRALRQNLLDAQTRQATEIAAVRPRHRYSATNLVHYVELRRHEIRDLQTRLSDRGLSSLGRMESHVMVAIDALLDTLARLTGQDAWPAPAGDQPNGVDLLSHNAVSLLGPQPSERVARIMVTLPSEAATDSALIHDMLTSGMDIARINCAHDGPEAWSAMIDGIRAAEAATGRNCLVSMDLGGPKLRTGPIRPGPEVLRIKPERDELGAVTAPARLWLGGAPQGDGASTPVIPLLEPGWAGRRRPGEELRLLDARGARRTLTVERVQDDGCLVALRHTAYLVPGITVSSGRKAAKKNRDARIGPLPAAEQSILVRRGDRIVLTGDLTPAEPTTDGLHRIGCTLAGVFADVEPGQRVLLDDGKIGGVILDAAADELTVEVRSAAATGARLHAEKGINFPDTRLSLSALTEQDVTDLGYVKQHADIVEMSFVRSAADVRDLLRLLGTIDDHAIDIVLKIETVYISTRKV